MIGVEVLYKYTDITIDKEIYTKGVKFRAGDVHVGRLLQLNILRGFVVWVASVGM